MALSCPTWDLKLCNTSLHGIITLFVIIINCIGIHLIQIIFLDLIIVRFLRISWKLLSISKTTEPLRHPALRQHYATILPPVTSRNHSFKSKVWLIKFRRAVTDKAHKRCRCTNGGITPASLLTACQPLLSVPRFAFRQFLTISLDLVGNAVFKMTFWRQNHGKTNAYFAYNLKNQWMTDNRHFDMALVYILGAGR